MASSAALVAEMAPYARKFHAREPRSGRNVHESYHHDDSQPVVVHRETLTFTVIAIQVIFEYHTTT